MREVKCNPVPNCIPTPSSCVEWNGGDIEYLGICNGDSLNTLIWEVVGKLQDIAGEDLSKFDIDILLDICKAKAPTEVTLTSILSLVRDNQVCLKDYIDTLSSAIAELQKDSKININLKCYEQFDNIGNSLGVTREQLDQLIIDNLCNHKQRIESLEGTVVTLRSLIDNFDNTKTVEELTFATCVDAGVKPTSSQVKAVAQAHCDLQAATGSPFDIATALSKIPSDWNTKFGLLTGWDLTVATLAEALNNALLVIANHEARIKFMEENCCAVTCDDVKLGFTAYMNEDADGIIIKFTSGAGTSIPAAFTDKGSTGTIKDTEGNVETFTLAISNNGETEVLIPSLTKSGDLTINISTKLGTDSLTCEKCLNKTIKVSGSKCCVITNAGTEDVKIVYKIN